MTEQWTHKMAIVVRTDLGMSKGKIAGQVGHAVTNLVFHSIADYISRDSMLEGWGVTEEDVTA